MTTQTDDPLTRALALLEYLRAPKTDPVSLAFWDQVHDALLEAEREREALLAVADEARELMEAIDQYEAAVEAGEVGSIDKLGEVCVEAEDALVDALNHLHGLQQGGNEEASP